MPAVLIITFETGDAAAYDAVMDDMALGGRVPEGARMHCAGPYEGGWRVIDVWDDPDAFDRFAQEKIAPISARHGFAPPQIERVDCREVLEGGAGTPALAQVVRFDLDEASFTAMRDRVLADGPPADMLLNANGPSGDGWLVFTAWTSVAARDEFFEARVLANLPEGAARPRMEELHVHNSLRTEVTTA